MHVEFNIIAQNCQKYSFWCISKILFLEKNGAWDFSKHFVIKPYLWYKSGWILKDNTVRPLIHELLRSLINFFSNDSIMRKNKNWNEPIYIIVKFILLWNSLYFVFSRMNFRLLLSLPWLPPSPNQQRPEVSNCTTKDHCNWW